MVETCEIFDLAEEGEIDIEESFTEGFQMVVTEEDMVEHFDLTKTDMDDYWTMENDFTQEIDLNDYMMDYNDLFENVDFITLETSKVETFENQAICELDLNYNAVLDLCADVSAVPMNMGSLGKRTQGGALLRDAQGRMIPVEGKAAMTLHCIAADGRPVKLKEIFVVANVKQPLVAMGKWMKKGWMIQNVKDKFYLQKGDYYLPLEWQRNTLTLSFGLEEEKVSYVMDVSDELKAMAEEPGWHELSDGTPVLVVKNAFTFQDISRKYDPYQFPCRTTLVKLESGEYDCVESAQFWVDRKMSELDGISPCTTLTLVHEKALFPHEIQELYGQQIPPELLQDDLHAQVGGPPEPRLLPGEAEPVPEEMQAEEPQEGPHEPEQLVYDEVGDDFVMVNGLKLTTASSRKVMKDACEFLGTPLSGSKAVVFRRLQVAVRETAAKAALDAACNEKRAMERRPQQAEVPLAPTDEEKQRHLLTHLPFADWCEHCQATRSKDNERHERREQVCPTVALDYMTTNTTIRKESPEVKHLVAVDSWSKAILAVPIKAKGGASVKLCANAMCGFVRDYDKVIIKGDQEPSLKQVMKAVADARRLLKLQTTQEFSPQGRSASNPAERAIQTVRRLGNTLLESIRVGCGIEIPASHPLFVWCYAHASWLYNRFHVTPGGNTPFEVVTSRTYSGKLAPFGACVYGQPLPVPKNTRRGVPTWRKGIYVGKLMDSDLNFLLSPNGLFVTRAVRRCADEWQPEFLMACRGLPWDDASSRKFGPTTKVDKKRSLESQTFPGLQDDEAKAVEEYARRRAEEALAKPFGELEGSDEEYLDDKDLKDKQKKETELKKPGDGEREQPVPYTPENLPYTPTEPPDDLVMKDAEQDPQHAGGVRDEPQGGLHPQVPQQHGGLQHPQGELRPHGELPGEEPPTKSARTEPVKKAKVEFAIPPRTSPSSSPTASSLAAAPSFAGGIQEVALDEQEFVEVDEYPLVDLNDWGEFNEIDLEQESEEAGPPDVFEEMLAQLELEADEREITRLKEMGVLIPKSGNFEGYRFLTTKKVYDWRWRLKEETDKFGWMRRSLSIGY